METNKLLHGKSGLQRLVSLEVGENDVATAFIQDESGVVTSRTIGNRFWLLASRQLHSSFKRLSGNLHYCWGRQYVEKKDWQRDRSMYKNAGEDVYSIYDCQEALLVKDGMTYYRGMRQKELSLLSFDLETTGLDGLAKDAKVLLISTTFRDVHDQVNKLFAYDEYKSEKDLIEAFCTYVREKDPSLLVGHNIIGYDFSYLRHRAAVTKATFALGRDGSEVQFDSYESKFRLDGTRDLLYYGVRVYGREIVDTMMLMISFDVSKSMETYALKPMIKQLGFEKEGRAFYDASQIRVNYTNPVEWAKIKQYAIDDAEDAVKLWDYAGGLYFNMAPLMSKPFTKILTSASGSKINGMLVRAYLQDGHSIPKAEESRKFEGAISFAVPGIYNNCFKIDLASLYPSIILEYDVYPSEKDPKQYFLELVKTFRAQRLEYKRLAAETGDSYYRELDTTAKGILNSFYGFLGCPGINFNDYECAEFITKTGREILEYTIKWASGKPLADFVTKDTDEEEQEDEIA